MGRWASAVAKKEVQLRSRPALDAWMEQADRVLGPRELQSLGSRRWELQSQPQTLELSGAGLQALGAKLPMSVVVRVEIPAGVEVPS